MSTRISTKQRLISQLESIDSTLRDIVSLLTKRSQIVNLEPLVELLLERDAQLKSILTEVESQHELQKKIDLLRVDCAKSDKQIHSCQLQLKKAEVLLSTALYYSRQKLESMTKAVKNPIDIEELVRFSHRISAAHGVSAPDNWVQGDPRRPYPNREEIRRGYLGHLDDSGNFRPSIWDALSETAAAASLASASGMTNSSAGNTNVTPVMQAVPSTASSTVTGLDTLSMARSPNMLLPGVNMVSSPISVSQSNVGSWTNSTVSNNCESSHTRTPTLSLTAMLESHSRTTTTLLPPSSRLATDMLSPGITVQPGGRTSGQVKTAGSTNRSGFSVSPGLTSSIHQNYGESGPSPKSTLVRNKQIKRKLDETEMMSSDTCSDSSTDD